MGSLGFSNITSLTSNEKSKQDGQTESMNVGLVQTKTIGALLEQKPNSPKLFTPLKIRGVTFHNRIFVSPMCMYSCVKQDGVMTDFHLAHYGNLALRGPGLVIVEASSVEPRGRLSPEDVGIWGDEHVAPLRRVVNLVHASGSKIGVQIAHGGRKAGLRPPFYNYEENNGKMSTDLAIAPKSVGGFPDDIVSASPLPWKPVFYPPPHELTTQEVEETVQKFADAARRCVEAGVDMIEIHGAHGYLIHNFLSGNTNKRTDKYGGTPAKRLQFLIEIVTAVRAVIPEEMPLFCRLSGTDYATGDDVLCPDPHGWDVAQVIDFSRKAVTLGLDLLDVSSGHNLSGKKIPYTLGFGLNVPLSEAVKKANVTGLLVGVVGSMHSGKFAEQVLQNGQADATFVGREFIKDPSYVYTAARELGVIARWAHQYSWMWPLK